MRGRESTIISGHGGALDSLRAALEDRLRFETIIADLTARFVNLDSDLIDGAILALQEFAWPGNVRERRNVIERAVIVSKGPRLLVEPPRARRMAKLEIRRPGR